MRVIAIKEMSMGNAEVGEMWKETKILDTDKNTLLEVMQWVGAKKNVVLSVPDGEDVPVKIPGIDCPF